MRTGFKTALLFTAIGTIGLAAADANATARVSSSETKKAQQAAAADRHERLRLCRKQSYARNPGGEYYNSDARAREIEQCYMNGGRLM